MDNEEVIRIVRRYAKDLSNKMNIKKVYLFGSYAKGSANIDSDIDVAVVMDHFEGDFLDTEAMMYRVRRNIDERIELILIYEQSDRSGFLDDIKKHGLEVYG
jgi:uncharacterized protein